MRSKPRIILTPRTPPSLKMRAKTGVGLRGWASWEFWRNGVIYATGKQRNLIVDQALDEFASRGFAGTGVRDTLKVGTDSSAPANGNTNLGAAVVDEDNTATTIGTTGNGDTPSVGQFQLAEEFQWAIDFTGSYNLTEWGLFTSGDLMMIRELFRDVNGDPITISVQANDRLTFNHTLELIIEPWDSGQVGVAGPTFNIEERDRQGNLLSTTPYSTLHTIDDNTDYERLTGSIINPATREQSESFGNTAGGWTITPMDASYVRFPSSVSTNHFRTHTYPSYTPGSYSYTRTHKATADQANGTWYGIWYGHHEYASRDHAYLLRFDGPASFTKANTHTFEFDFNITWGRAP